MSEEKKLVGSQREICDIDIGKVDKFADDGWLACIICAWIENKGEFEFGLCLCFETGTKSICSQRRFCSGVIDVLSSKTHKDLRKLPPEGSVRIIHLKAPHSFHLPQSLTD
jgi:hypothetical protein